MRISQLLGTAFVTLLLILSAPSPAHATRVPSELKDEISDKLPDSKFRPDGGIETGQGDLFILLLPSSSGKKRGKAHIFSSFPNDKDPSLLFCENGWCYARVQKKGTARTVLIPAELPDKLRKQLLSCKFPSDFIVPENFVLPESLKSLLIDQSIPVQGDATISSSTFGSTPRVGKSGTKADHGVLFLTSLNTGTITMVDEQSLNKMVDFPTEGTPCSLAWAAGRLYITDQAKHRILLLDPAHKEFLGQIDLPARSAPKGLAIIPSGQLMYVSESSADDVAVIETATRKVLMRTKVAPGPGKMALCPNGQYLLVLNVPSGQLTIISTQTQAVVATLQVGSVPTAIDISSDSHLAYVSNRASNTVSIIDIDKRKLSGKMETGLGPTGIALSSDNSKLYVANARENSIAVYDTQTHQKLQDSKLPVEIDFPGTISLMPDGKRLLVSSEASDTIALLNLDKFEFEKQSSIGHSSHDILWVPTN